MSGPKEGMGSAASDTRPAAGELEHVLRFRTLEEAEATLRRLDGMLRESRGVKDSEAATRVLEIAREGRRRAQMIAGNQRVTASKRAEKEEIRQWFRVWLEAPDAFFDWLELRKGSAEFRERFGQK